MSWWLVKYCMDLLPSYECSDWVQGWYVHRVVAKHHVTKNPPTVIWVDPLGDNRKALAKQSVFITGFRQRMIEQKSVNRQTFLSFAFVTVGCHNTQALIRRNKHSIAVHSSACMISILLPFNHAMSTLNHWDPDRIRKLEYTAVAHPARHGARTSSFSERLCNTSSVTHVPVTNNQG